MTDIKKPALSPETLRELRALLARVPSGTWRKTVRDDGREAWIDADGDADKPGAASMNLCAWTEKDGTHPWLDLLVAARNSLPALLDSLDSLRAKLAESEAACAVLLSLSQMASPERWKQVLSNLPASVQRHLKEVEALRERSETLEDAVRWALGEGGDDFPPRGKKDGPYWWRIELRKRAALRVPPHDHPEGSTYTCLWCGKPCGPLDTVRKGTP